LHHKTEKFAENIETQAEMETHGQADADGLSACSDVALIPSYMSKINNGNFLFLVWWCQDKGGIFHSSSCLEKWTELEVHKSASYLKPCVIL
jgi:hypothetical protein